MFKTIVLQIIFGFKSEEAVYNFILNLKLNNPVGDKLLFKDVGVLPFMKGEKWHS